MHPDLSPAPKPRTAVPWDLTPIANGVWSPWRFNLGDHWQTVNYLLTRSFVLREEQLLSRWQHGQDNKDRFEEILALIKGPERSCVTLVDEVGTHEPDGFDVWAAPSWPTHATWKAHERHALITYQFDGISSAEDKNPPFDDYSRLLTTLMNRSEYTTRLDKCLTLSECVDLLCQSRFFVGVDSGMSHLAHAVGVPTIIIEYKLPIITCHRGKHFMHARGTDEAIAMIDRLLR